MRLLETERDVDLGRVLWTLIKQYLETLILFLDAFFVGHNVGDILYVVLINGDKSCCCYDGFKLIT